MFKKAFFSFLTLILFLTASPLSWAEDSHVYQDVPATSGYFKAIDYLRRNDVFMDTQNFHPEAVISKAEFIKYLVLLNSPKFDRSGVIQLPFQDTVNDTWYSVYFREAIDLGILDAREINAEPNKRLTVSDALLLLFHSQSIPVPAIYKGVIPYSDITATSHNAALYMRAVSLHVIAPAREDYFGIYRPVTRAMAAQMIYQMDLVNLGQDPVSPSPASQPATGSLSPELQKIVNVWQMVEMNFFYQNEVNRQAMSDAALKAMVETLGDKYSVYLDQQSYKNFSDSIDGSVEGIGAVLGYNEAKEIQIVNTLPGTPAEAIGLLANDVIMEVNGQSLQGKSIEEAVPLIKGPKGTTVQLKIRRGGNLLDFTVERKVITISSVQHETLNNGSIYHITLTQFSATANDELSQVLTTFKNDPKAKGIVFDLRGNPGGYLDVSVAILGHFIEAQQPVVQVNYKDFSQVLLSAGKAELKGVPMALLINESSASASEIVAGALKDYKAATLVGQTTFGKGVVQSVKILPDQSSLKLTVAEWRTPKGNSINKEGVEPDVVVQDNPEMAGDEQLQTGISELKKLMAQ